MPLPFRLPHIMSTLQALIKQMTLSGPVKGRPPCPKKIQTSPTQTVTVAVEGNIGSGKTTLIEYFKQFPGVEVLPEPVPMWTNFRGHNLMGLMYQDPTRWSLAFQTYVQLTMLQNHLTHTSKPIKLLERSLHSARYCFVENLFRSGKMSEAEYMILDDWYLWIVRNHPVNVNLIVYLQTRPEVVYERIRKRNRSEEGTIPLAYLQSLHEMYENWLIRKCIDAPVPAHILVVDANCDLDTVRQFYVEHKDRILCTVQV